MKNRNGAWKIKQCSDYGFTINPYHENELEPYFQLSPQKSFIDIGAHVGKWSVYAAKHQPKAHIYACEPNSETYNYLINNIHLNALERIITPLSTALSNFNGRTGFMKNSTYTSTSRILPTVTANMVDVQTLPSLIEHNSIDLSSIELIKIDTEGEEFNILQGMSHLLPLLPSDCRIICEILDKNSKKNDIFKFMRQYGYRADELTCGSNVLFQKEVLVQVSVSILTLNEEKNIKRCLESVKYFNDIVIVDSGSSDLTLEIASEYPQVRIFKHPLESYAYQRNYASSKTLNPMVFVLDADEELSTPLFEEIKTIVKKKEFSHDIFSVQLVDYLWWDFARHSSWGSRQYRLFNKSRAYYKGLVHEQLIVLSQRIGKLQNSIYHKSHSSIEKTLTKFNRYADLEVTDYIRQGVRWRFLWLRIPYTFTKFFFGALIIKGFMRDGTLGIISAFLLSFYKALVLIKYAERTRHSQ
ncbi:MAG: FkbM family methyltransferase [Elusimicrobia bacterium]|nr:FkbM family methyltransferase [Elusimicrobiota bacterium]